MRSNTIHWNGENPNDVAERFLADEFPLDLFQSTLHEAAHYWCANSPVGRAIHILWLECLAGFLRHPRIGEVTGILLGYVHKDINKARRFSLEFKDKSYGIVKSHLIEVSEAFPAAIFLLEYFDMQASYSGKRVIRAGEVVQEVFDGDQRTQGLDWALLDIFAPFRAEYCGEEHEFGSLWTPWLDAIVAAAKTLKDQGSLRPVASEPFPLSLAR